MKRPVLQSVVLTAVSLCLSASWAQSPNLVAENAARRHGLTRPWFNQIVLDAGRSRVNDAVLDDGTLFVQTDHATVHAIDGETGQTVWSKQIGRPNHPSMELGLSRDLLVVVNGSRLYAVNRVNGEILYETQVGGAPGAGAAVSNQRAYVPMTNGLVLAYRLEPLTDPLKELGRVREDREMTPEERAAAAAIRRQNLQLKHDFVPPLACQSLGRALIQPLVTRQTKLDEFCVWPTDRGYLNIGIVTHDGDEKFAIKFRMEVPAGIECRPAYLPPDPKVAADPGLIIVGGRDGIVYAVIERNGEVQWRFSAGDPIVISPVVLDDRMFVTTQFGGMYCLESKTGKDKWWAADVMRFLAASKERIYAVDKLGRLQILSAATGQRLDALLAGDLSMAVPNNENDRIYVVSPTGLVQCLHEVGQDQPLKHNEQRKVAATEQQGMDEQPAAGKKGGETKPADKKEPKDKAPKAEGGDNPFDAGKGGPAKGAPAKGAPAKGKAKGGENPFM